MRRCDAARWGLLRGGVFNMQLAEVDAEQNESTTTPPDTRPTHPANTPASHIAYSEGALVGAIMCRLEAQVRRP
jgi:hypothetical protein